MADKTEGTRGRRNPWLMATANVIGCFPLLGLVVAVPLLFIWAITALLHRTGGTARGPHNPNGPDHGDPAP